MAHPIHITPNSARYTSIALHDDDLWTMRVLAECATGRKNFDDLSTAEAERLLHVAKHILSRV